ncbi:hypothetical protein K491DRAFT_508892 [Lophiostoma macrostomum CBS 122681]|uniref:Uncharacterized protein n=1 Tax=Lophiostoma macrostomum CBS 122681 TaxID=1314788 RepID=A0A6A6T582_9PLEO|nr:hypothetical protein K491DRAFT_508892 [Lophiostoma macrostomum CBS 122681]
MTWSSKHLALSSSCLSFPTTICDCYTRIAQCSMQIVWVMPEVGFQRASRDYHLEAHTYSLCACKRTERRNICRLYQDLIDINTVIPQLNRSIKNNQPFRPFVK